MILPTRILRRSRFACNLQFRDLEQPRNDTILHSCSHAFVNGLEGTFFYPRNWGCWVLKNLSRGAPNNALAHQMGCHPLTSICNQRGSDRELNGRHRKHPLANTQINQIA